jgi:hypothetical protein
LEYLERRLIVYLFLNRKEVFIVQEGVVIDFLDIPGFD